MPFIHRIVALLIALIELNSKQLTSTPLFIRGFFVPRIRRGTGVASTAQLRAGSPWLPFGAFRPSFYFGEIQA